MDSTTTTTTKKFRALSYAPVEEDGDEEKQRIAINCELIILNGIHYTRGHVLNMSLLDDTKFGDEPEEDTYLEDMLDDILEGDHNIDIQYSGGIDFDKGIIYNANARRRWEAQHERDWSEKDRNHAKRRIMIYGPWPEDLPVLNVHRALIYTDDKGADGNNTHVRVNCEMVFLKNVEHERGAVIPLQEFRQSSFWKRGILDDILDGSGLGLTPSAAIDFDDGSLFRSNGRAKWMAVREIDRQQDSGATPMELSYKYYTRDD